MSKNVWITGASSGIGKELAIKFANSGWIVAASARRKNLLEKLSEINKNIKPFPLDITEKGNVEQTFKKIANGVPGIETRMPLLFSEGVGRGRLSVNEFVSLTSTNAAKIFGLYPRKGTIAVGSDADMAIWDPSWKRTISQLMLHDNMNYTPYEGMEVTGWPRTVIIRGRVAVDDETLKLDRGAGKFLKRTPAQPRLEPLSSSPLSPSRNFGANLL